MPSYKELGLVNTVELFKKAVKGGYAIPAYNFNNMEQLQAIVSACVETKSPVILQVSAGARKYANQTMLQYMAKGAVEYAKELGFNIPIVLHLDHGDSFELCKSCIESGFSSVMIDGSSLPYEDNVALTKKVVDFAHSQKDYVSVEGELGVLAGVEDEVASEHSHYTQPSTRSRTSSRKRASTPLPSPSAPATAARSSSPSSAPKPPTVSSFPRPSASTSSRKSRSVCPGSPSSCTAPRACPSST